MPIQSIQGWRRVALVIGLALVLLAIAPSLHHTRALAQSGVESRVFRLESEAVMLRARVSQLESQVSRLSRASGLPAASAPPQESPVGESALADDPTFKRLATLVIELRDRIIALEEQIGRSPQH